MQAGHAYLDGIPPVHQFLACPPEGGDETGRRATERVTKHVHSGEGTHSTHGLERVGLEGGVGHVCRRKV